MSQVDILSIDAKIKQAFTEEVYKLPKKTFRSTKNFTKGKIVHKSVKKSENKYL